VKKLILTVLLLLAAASPAAAACPKTTLGDVEDEVMCPVCGTPLGLATEAPQAQRERELIRRLVDDCRSKDEVKAVLKREYGEEVLAVPEAKGFDLAAYLVPGVAILLAGGAVGAAALRWRRTRAQEDQSESASPAAGRRPAPTATSERLETDLERYDL
jgi:cytochrome c-type biogenesis protein CcmH/NrfF